MLLKLAKHVLMFSHEKFSLYRRKHIVRAAAGRNVGRH